MKSKMKKDIGGKEGFGAAKKREKKQLIEGSKGAKVKSQKKNLKESPYRV
jgi:hypothetical protein